MPARSTTTQLVSRARDCDRSNDALVRRGSLTPCVERETLEAWRDQGPTRQGARSEDSDLAIACLRTLRAVYHLTRRATEGFARSLFALMDVDRPVADSSTRCRRAATVPITRPKETSGPLHRVLESTALAGDGEGGWAVRQDGSSKRRTGLKLARAVDPRPHEIAAAMVTEPGVTDAEAVPASLEPVANPVEGASADGAYGRRAVYEAWDRRGARAGIPPRRDVTIPRPGNPAGPRLARDENRRRIRQIGRAAREEESGDHRRSLGATAMSRMKTRFGPGVSRRADERRATAGGIRCRALDLMTDRAMPDTIRVAA